MLRRFYRELRAVSAQFQSKRSYEIKYAILFTFQMTGHFDSVLITGSIKRFFTIFIPAVLLVDDDDNRKFLFFAKNFPLKGKEM